MTSLIAWLDASSEDQRRMREIVNLFSERESRDELGIGQVRDALSDSLWPGTSTLFTRARYFLFIPWSYREAAEARANFEKAAARTDANERRLIGSLKDVGEIPIGAQAGVALKNLPSALYWGGMAVNGVLIVSTLSREDAVVAEVARAHSRGPVGTEFEDDLAVATHVGAFHSTLPPVPAGFPQSVPDGFAMTRAEAEWLRDRILASSPGTLFEHALEKRPDATSATPWEDSSLMRAGGDPARVLDDARRFSTLMHSASLLYNLLLAEAYEREGFTAIEAPVDQYRERIRVWAARPGLSHDIATWDRDSFWTQMLQRNPNINRRSRAFIDTWTDLMASAPLDTLADNERVRGYVREREREHKRGQARISNKRLLQAWQGSSASGPLVYRWPQLRTILNDIHDGLERADA